MKAWQIILSGVGGQGLMLSGNLLGSAATVYEGKKAAMTSAFGVETRGTFAKSDVIVSDSEIDFPEVLKADVVIALDMIAYKKYADSLGEGSLLIYDESFEHIDCKAKQSAFPIFKIAKDKGNPAAANIAALGILVKLTGLVSEEAVRSAIRDEFGTRERLVDLNLAVFEAALEAVK
ncbi:MAG: 2-oxoacid:acceptor oxidoreductase family protein [Defluviitaleaceae bacterium]|nr:2-oxoacid:acceptor oxidoreductase family protein [Defluviitaleaceae bacterium]